MLRTILVLVVACGLSGAASAQPQVFYQRYQVGRTQVDRGQFAAAVTAFQSALAAVPSGQAPDPNIYVALGYAQMRLGRVNDANASFNLAQDQIGRLTATSRQQLTVNRQVLRQVSVFKH
jgi:Flp pilus assembly protein TadD